MIKNFLEAVSTLSNCHDGIGEIKIANLFDSFSTNMQFFHYTVLPPGTSIGLHKHGNDEEFYVILEGDGEMELDDALHIVKTADIIKNKPFGSHSLKNISDLNELRILVFEVKNNVL